MGFAVPNFNLMANVWHQPDPAVSNYAAPDLVTQCNLSPGKRVMSPLGGGGFGVRVLMELLLPKLTDVRARWNSGQIQDTIEVPAGTGRFYVVQQVDDVGKGFTNEYRIAWMNYAPNQTFADTGLIVGPIPLP